VSNKWSSFRIHLLSLEPNLRDCVWANISIVSPRLVGGITDGWSFIELFDVLNLKFIGLRL
jgi:hypothetical protein